MPASRTELRAELPDPRAGRGLRHPLVPVLAQCLAATLGGCTSVAAVAQV